MEDLCSTDRKCQLFFPEGIYTESSNGKGYADCNSYDDHLFPDEFLEPRVQGEGSDVEFAVISDYILQDESNVGKSCSDSVNSGHTLEQFPILQENFCNFAPENIFKKNFSSKENAGQCHHHPDEREHNESFMYPRKEGIKQGSLFDLTIRFFHILLQSPNEGVDLNTASRKLNIRKRRLYDVLNVCEGVGMLDKSTKNCVKLKETGADAISNMHKFWQLQNELRMIEEEESEVERELVSLNDMSSSIIRCPSCCQLSTPYSDSDQKQLLIEAPSGSILKVLKPKLSTETFEWQYRVVVTSSGGKLRYRILSEQVSPEYHYSPPTHTPKSFNLTKYWPYESVSKR